MISQLASPSYYLPEWAYWIVVVAGALTWRYWGFLQNLVRHKGQKTQNVLNAIQLLEKERDVFIADNLKLRNQLNSQSTTELITDNPAVSEERQKSEVVSVEVSHAELTGESEATEGGKLSEFMLAIEKFRVKNYSAGLVHVDKICTTSGLDKEHLWQRPWLLLFALKQGNEEALIDLERIARESTECLYSHNRLAEAFVFLEKPLDAARILQKALAEIDDPENRIDSVLLYTTVLESIGNLAPSLDLIREELDRNQDSNQRSALFCRAAELFQNLELEYESSCALEKALELRPLDFGTRFKLAYKYSEKSANKFAAYHYLKHCAVSPDEASLNNLGVSYSAVKLPILSVRRYRESIEKGGTLAASNLALSLVGTGLISEAETILNAAITEQTVHDNVYSTMNHIRIAQKNEEERESEMLKIVGKYRRYRLLYADAIARPLLNCEAILGKYSDSNGNLSIVVCSESKVSGVIELKGSGHVGSFSGAIVGSGIRFSWTADIPPELKASLNVKTASFFDSVLKSVGDHREEQGLLVFETDRLVGYSASDGNNLDGGSKSITEWSLVRLSS